MERFPIVVLTKGVFYCILHQKVGTGKPTKTSKSNPKPLTTVGRGFFAFLEIQLTVGQKQSRPGSGAAGGYSAMWTLLLHAK